MMNIWNSKQRDTSILPGKLYNNKFNCNHCIQVIVSFEANVKLIIPKKLKSSQQKWPPPTAKVHFADI